MPFDGMFLKICRTRKRLSRKALAEKVGVSARTIQHYEDGDHAPSPGVLHALEDALDLRRGLLDDPQNQPLDPVVQEVIRLMASPRVANDSSSPLLLTPPGPDPVAVLFGKDHPLLGLLLDGQRRVEARLERIEALLCKIVDGGGADGR